MDRSRLHRYTLMTLAWVLLAAPLLVEAIHADEAPPAEKEGPTAESPKEVEPTGTWTLIAVNRGRTIESTLTLRTSEEGALEGLYARPRREAVVLEGLTYEAPKLTFHRTVRNQRIRFEALLEGDQLKGHHQFGSTKIHVFGGRTEAAIAAARTKAKAYLQEASKRSDDPEEDYERHSNQVKPRDWFPVLDHPQLVKAADSKGVLEKEPVIGITYGGEARAYPVSIMGVHELVNDTCGGVPLAVSW